MDLNCQEERGSPLLQCGDFLQGTYGQSEMQKSKKTEGGKDGPLKSLKHMEDMSEAMSRQASTSAMLKSAQTPLHREDGPGTALWRVNNHGDCHPDTASKSGRMAQLEEMVNRLKNALISLEEENLSLNKKVKVSILAQKMADCAGPSSSNADQTSHERPKQVADSRKAEVLQEICEREDAFCHEQQREDECFPPGEEKQDVRKKLQRVEEYSRESTKELGRILRKYEELRVQHKTMEKHCKQLMFENQRLAMSLEALKGEPQCPLEDRGGTKALLDQAHAHCTKLAQEKDQLEAKALSLASEVTQLREELGASQLEAQLARDQGVLLEAEAKATEARRSEEARHLQEKLREGEEKSQAYEGAVSKLRDEQVVLENCLRTVQKERDLLQLELRKLHQDYIELSGTISLQLRAKNPSRPGPSQGPPDPPNYSSMFARQDKAIGGDKIDQIRKRLEEEELMRAQKYKDMIDKSV